MERGVEWKPKELKVYPPIYRFGHAGRWLRGRLQAGKMKNMLQSMAFQYCSVQIVSPRPGGPALHTEMNVIETLKFKFKVLSAHLHRHTAWRPCATAYSKSPKPSTQHHHVCGELPRGGGILHAAGRLHRMAD